jgi:aminopeptidase N
MLPPERSDGLLRSVIYRCSIMIRNLLHCVLALACLTSTGTAGETAAVCRYENRELPGPLTDKPGRKYARDRFADIRHLTLDVTPDFAKRTVRGTATLSFAPIAKPLTRLELDAVGLTIEGITAKGATLSEHDVRDEKLILVFKEPIAAGQEASVSIMYHAEPGVGLHFRTPEMGYKPGDTQVWSQGEAEQHRHWFPCYDYPNARFTSEVICHVPEGMEVVSNGSLVGKQRGADGLMAWHWKQDKPHVNYLVALAAGYFHKIEDRIGTVPLAVLVPPSEKARAANAFRDTKAIIEFYQRETGVPFPWDKYYQVYCLDFTAGGMENTSCTFQAARLLFDNDTEQIRTLHRLDAHETAHQWFGDLVTCRDWSHLWLNEGFASYYTVLYEEQKSGRDAMLFALWNEAQGVFRSSDTRPTVWRDYRDPMEQFDFRVYPKGAWILHMMRSRLGPELYRRSIHAYLERHRNGIATTDDLQAAIEEQSGLSFDQFFDQWLYHGGVPELKVEYTWDAASKLAKVTVKQTQKISADVLLFSLELPIRFSIKGQDRPIDFKVTAGKAEEEFYFPLPSQPELVRIDPDYTLLAKIEFQPPPDMLKRQLGADVIGRILAVQSLGNKHDAASTELLKQSLNNDAFHGVRSEAATALKKQNTPESRAVLAQSLDQPDARVRLAVMESLAAFPHPEAWQALWEQSQHEKNPAILAAIIRTWGARPGNEEVSAALRKFLATKSYQNALAGAAIAALRAQDDGTVVPTMLKLIVDILPEFAAHEKAQALDALAFLARDERHTSRDDVLALLAMHLNSPDDKVRAAAAKSLGTLRNPKALALLQPLVAVSKPYKDAVRPAAEKSIQELESEKARPQELKDVWTKMQDLQKKTEALEKQLEKLSKKSAVEKPDAGEKPTPANPAK